MAGFSPENHFFEKSYKIRQFDSIVMNSGFVQNSKSICPVWLYVKNTKTLYTKSENFISFMWYVCLFYQIRKFIQRP